MFFYLLWSESGFPFLAAAQCSCILCGWGVVDMNYLRQDCLEDVEWSLRGAEQLQCPRFLLHWLQAGSTGKMAKHSTWHPIQNALSRSCYCKWHPLLLRVPPPPSFLLPGKLLDENLLQIFSRKLCQYEKHGLEVLVRVQRTLRACFTRFGVVGIVESHNIKPAKLLQWFPWRP